MRMFDLSFFLCIYDLQVVVDCFLQVNYLVSKLETEGTTVPYRQVAEKTDTFLKQLYFLPGHPAV